MRQPRLLPKFSGAVLLVPNIVVICTFNRYCCMLVTTSFDNMLFLSTGVFKSVRVLQVCTS